MSSAAMTGRIFNNRYQITERIGIGGMAEVYQAQDNVLGRRVAVKVMLPQYASDAAFAQRFRLFIDGHLEHAAGNAQQRAKDQTENAHHERRSQN